MNRRKFLKSAMCGVAAATVPIVVKAKNSAASMAIVEAPPGYSIISGYERLVPSYNYPSLGARITGVKLHNDLVYATTAEGRCFYTHEKGWKELTLENPDKVDWPVELEYRGPFIKFEGKISSE